MGRRRTRYGWPYDPELEQFTTPSGRTITLHEIATRLQDDVHARHDLHGPWEGWKIRGDRLKPPRTGKHGPALKPDTLPQFLRWIDSAQGQVGKTTRAPTRQPVRTDKLHRRASSHFKNRVVNALLALIERT